MPGSQKLLYRNKKGELFPYDKSVNNNGLQFCCDRYNKALNECYEFIRLVEWYNINRVDKHPKI